MYKSLNYLSDMLKSIVEKYNRKYDDDFVKREFDKLIQSFEEQINNLSYIDLHNCKELKKAWYLKDTYLTKRTNNWLHIIYVKEKGNIGTNPASQKFIDMCLSSGISLISNGETEDIRSITFSVSKNDLLENNFDE